MSKTELDIINTMAFRRLHDIKQLSHTYLVYPTATHTRYEHSLGAMHMAGRMCDKLDLSDEEKKITRLAALLHDIGHGPFSHTFELILKDLNPGIKHPHEHIGHMLIEHDSEIDSCLGSLKHEIIKILRPTQKPSYPLLSEIVTGNLDADKLDYFARDSYNLGVKYGVVDTERILYLLRKSSDGNQVGIGENGIYMIDSYRLARHMIATQIYSHRVRLIADQMFHHAVSIAFDEGVLDKSDFIITPGYFLKSYIQLDDYSFVNKIMLNGKGKVSHEILNNIKQRKLLKVCYRSPGVSLTNKSKDGQILQPNIILPKISQEIRETLGLRQDQLIFYESDLPLTLFGESAFPILDNKGQQCDRLPLSPIQADASVISYYVFGKADKRDQITRHLAEKGVSSYN